MISLCLLLELTVYLVSGQTLGDISSNSGTTTGVLTDQILQFSEVGIDRNTGLRCTTDNVDNTVWQTPDGATIDNRFEGPASGSELFTIRDSGAGIITLVRGPNYLSPDGRYCCVKTTTNQRTCVYLTVCPTLNALSQGRLSYIAATNTATTDCNAGVFVASAGITCNEGTMMWSADQPLCLAGTIGVADNNPSGDLTGRILQFSEVGSGNSNELRCLVSDTANVEWQDPDGNTITSGTGTANSNELFSVETTNSHVALRRGSTHNTQDGEYCCVRTGTNERRCVYLTACPTLRTRGLGTVTYNAEDNTATTNCFEGIAVAPFNMVLTCTTSGWSGDQPSCRRICPDLTLDNGMITYQYPNIGTTVTANYEGTIATHTCNTGYEQSGGSTTRTCGSNAGGAINIGGTWSGSTFTCTRVNCSNPPAVTNGAVLSMTGTLFEDTVTYNCNNGYQPGSATIMCQANMTWTTEPTCLPVDCGSLTNPTNGQVVTSGTTFTSPATYTCNDGYRVNGASTRTCEANGVWSGTDPTCEELCPRQSLTNGVVIYSNETIPPPVGTVSVYTCGNGFLLAGNAIRTCVDGSGWSGDLPVCTGYAGVNSCDAGYAVALAIILLVLLAAVTVIVILVILLIVTRKQLKEARVQLGRQQVYDTPDQVYYEDVSKMGVGGASKEGHTHQSAMELRQCPAYAPTEVPDRTEERIYDN